MRVAVVGAGIAGIACARVLQACGAEVVVLDRGRVPGGRMASRRLDGRIVDLGASYLVARNPTFTAVVEDWHTRGLAQPWTDAFAVWDGQLAAPRHGPVRWSAREGLRSLVTDLAAGLDVRTAEVQRVDAVSVDGQPYDEVVLAMPDPQALRLLAAELVEERAALAGRGWDPVLALAARIPARSWEWDGVWVHDSAVLEWVADDGARRGDGAPVLVAHSTPTFARQHLAEPAAAAPAMIDELARIGVPDAQVQFVQRWTYAKPVGARDPLYLRGRVSICGDGWGASKVEAAWLSGTALGQVLCS